MKEIFYNTIFLLYQKYSKLQNIKYCKIKGEEGNMNIDQILSSLEINNGTFPYEAVQQAVEQKDEIIPFLLDRLSTDNTRLEYIKQHPNYMGHVYAMFLLAQFRENRAYPLIVQFFSHSNVDYEDVTGDFYLEDLPQALASVCHNDLSLIKQSIENKKLDQWVRGSFLRSLLVLVANNRRSREEIMDYFHSLFHGKIERTPSHVWNSLVLCSCSLQPKEVFNDIKNAFNEGLVDPVFLDMNDVNNYMKHDWGELLLDLQNDPHHSLITDTVREMEWWSCFKDEKQEKLREKELRKLRIDLGKKTQRKKKKIGRNDLCPCGSGKKYKKCCGSIANKT